MDEPLVQAMQSVVALPRPALRPWINRYTGYLMRTAPGSHQGLPSRNVTFIITLDGAVDLAGRGSYSTLAGGLHATPVHRTRRPAARHPGRVHAARRAGAARPAGRRARRHGCRARHAARRAGS